jgi:hypothetical protein
MSTLKIENLEKNEALDQQAMQAVAGGWFKKLRAAFSAGYAIGTLLDKKFHLSDRIAGVNGY